MGKSEADRKYILKKKFGITEEHYSAMLDRQGGRCAICLKRPRTKKLAVDHNHRTNRVRGLLCVACNYILLGIAKAGPATLRRAADYLEKPPGVPWEVGPPPMPTKSDRMIERGVLKRIKTKTRKSGPNPLI